MTLLTLGVVYALATDYGLSIRGVSITSTGDINAGQTKGTINWDGTTLTFTNVNVTYNGSNSSFIYYSGTQDLPISFIGDNTINSNRTILKSSSSNTITIKGERNATGTLNMKLTDNAIASWNVIEVEGNLKIRFLYLNVTGKDYAISGSGSNKFDVSETVLKVKAPSGSEGAVREFASASFYAYDAYLTTGVFNTKMKAVCDKNGNPLQVVETDASLFVNKVIVGVGYASEMGVYPQGLNSGSIRYSYKTNTLTLDGVDIECIDRFIDNKKLDSLKIVVKGTNTVDAHKTWGIFSQKNFSIEGASSSYSNNKLTINNAFGPLCLWLDNDNGTMTLKNLTFNGTGSRTGIYCTASSGLEGTLKIDTCKVQSEVTGDSYSCVYGFKTCTLTGCEVNTAITPVLYNTEKMGYTNVVGALAKKASIDVPTTTYNGLKVLGTPVTNLNASNILVDGQTSGTISYDNAAKRLSLNEVELTAPEGNENYGFYISSSAVTEINITDVNNITTQGHVIYFIGSGTITMTGTNTEEVSCEFYGTSTGQSGLSMDGSGGFVFDVDGTVKLKGKDRGIWGNGYTYSTSIVTMKKRGTVSDYYFQGENKGAIVNVADLILDGMDFFYNPWYGTPGCYFDERYVRQNGGEVVMGDNVVNFFGKGSEYGITVAGTPVNSCNKMAIGSKYITGGGPKAVSYDSDHRKLTLDNATIEYHGEDFQFMPLKNEGVNDLNIILVGDNVINNAGYTALDLIGGSFAKPFTTTITGNGKLDAKSSWYALRIGSFNTLDIGGKVEIKAEGSDCGIANNMIGSAGETLIIREKAHVMAKGWWAPSVQRLNDIQLKDGIKILQPAGAEIKKDNTFGWGVYVGDEMTKEWVVFGTRIKGDVNGDGAVDVADIATVIDTMAAGNEATPEQISAADVNEDTGVDVADIASIIDIMAAGARKTKNQEE